MKTRFLGGESQNPHKSSCLFPDDSRMSNWTDIFLAGVYLRKCRRGFWASVDGSRLFANGSRMNGWMKIFWQVFICGRSKTVFSAGIKFVFYQQSSAEMENLPLTLCISNSGYVLDPKIIL
ncbi:hypothetical protein [Aequorivita lipolytica]|uniref:Uncharacterized protein n=1 Tax=Aequorivita lipolytica TaxID=153267 RepID=A0A5C6YKL1_9FLAO|nr:hypothetical protein [Aequorivita lipolytica]TXD67707.1 hypothetical protein ESV24_15215 [Aequorivita lipolytica]